MIDKIKTVRGWISAARRLDANTIDGLKGFDQLSEAKKTMIGMMSAGIANDLGEWDSLTKVETQ